MGIWSYILVGRIELLRAASANNHAPLSNVHLRRKAKHISTVMAMDITVLDF